MLLTLSQGLSSISCSASEELHKKLPGQVTQTVQKDIPYDSMPHVVYKQGELPGTGDYDNSGTGLVLVSGW